MLMKYKEDMIEDLNNPVGRKEKKYKTNRYTFHTLNHIYLFTIVNDFPCHFCFNQQPLRNVGNPEGSWR